ncbi:MAG: hypothetical protein IPP40_15570 [bacterium]|nr:hypothetical protein [bacterium]
MHRGEPFRVQELDLKRKQAHVVPHRSPTYTMIRTQKETEILDVRKTRPVHSFIATQRAKVTEHFVRCLWASQATRKNCSQLNH